MVKITEPEKLEIGHARVGTLGVHLTVNCLIISLQIPSPSFMLGGDFLIECFAIQMCVALWQAVATGAVC